MNTSTVHIDLGVLVLKPLLYINLFKRWELLI